MPSAKFINPDEATARPARGKRDGPAAMARASTASASVGVRRWVVPDPNSCGDTVGSSA